MKPRLPILFFLALLCASVYSQVPKGFNYQAIARDASKNPITNPIGVRFTIQSDSLGGSVFWVEEHLAVQPNEYGLFTAIIGKGARISGLAKFSDIDWTVTPKFIKTEINNGTWKLMGSARMLTVPYALVADSLGGPVSKLSVKGTTANMEEALFEVKNNTGQTIFAVYNEGVRIYVDNGSKGTKGGFAVSGFGNDKDAFSDKYLFVSRDSIRMWLDPNPATKAVKGGFAVGSFDYTKGKIQNLLNVNADSVRVFIDDLSGKAVKGGFAVSGFNNAKGPLDNFLKVDVAKIKAGKTEYINLTPANTFIGEEAGKNTVVSGVNGQYNSFIGYKAGNGNAQGSQNLFLGYRAGLNSNASYNIFIGNNTGLNNQGSNNIFIGESSGESNAGGNGNTFMGYQTGKNNNNGYNNLFLGFTCGAYNTDGSENVFIGYASGNLNRTGNYNLYLGSFAGSYNFYGSGNVCLGYGAGVSNTVSNKLYIENDPGLNGNALIYGDFSSGSRYVVINGLNNNGKNFFVNGSSGGTSAFAVVSDMRLKENILEIDNALSKVMKMRGVYFNWKPDAGDPSVRNMGFLAQEVLKVAPEVVDTKGSVYSVQYSLLTALLVEAIKDQQSEIESLKGTKSSLEDRLTSLQKQIDELRNSLLQITNK